MTYEWDSIKIRTSKGHGFGWHPRSTPLEALRRYSRKTFIHSEILRSSTRMRESNREIIDSEPLKYITGRTRPKGLTDECPVLLNGRRELSTLYVEDGTTWVPKCDGGLEEIPIDASGGQQGNISYECNDIVAVDRAQRRSYAGNLLEWRCDSVEARTGERVRHPLPR
ncbi:hypothetical protein CRG98_033679 [Punica granatum]|uniref:Uncharacterized protein n=1 Tax=Punica granatum TaxID=22663 RepID=A0A2I0IQE7_PUNGR|nr:hypothetical protein CRG98_033679 [Punica granatum]